MKNTIYILAFILQICPVFAFQQQQGFPIIPAPAEEKYSKGEFIINDNTTIYVNDPELKPLANILVEYLDKYLGFKLSINNRERNVNCIKLKINNQLSTNTYLMNVEKAVDVEGQNYKSVANAVASLIQLVDKNASLPQVHIKDYPVHNYRAVLVDVARFWQPLETLYETIDLMWFYKLEYLQLHFTDHQRFTIPLDDYPQLKTVNANGHREYYTKEELTALVEYAKDRGVSIVPEVELPGHSTALWQTYPEVFGNVNLETGEADQLHVVNIAKEEAYSAINTIIKEVASIFYTSPYIHIGADEVSLKNIMKVPDYMDYVEKHGLLQAANGEPQELFCHFINRLNTMVKAAGKKTLVWEGFPDAGAGSVTVDKDIIVLAWNTTYNTPQNLIDHGYTIINANWIPWYLVGAMNFVPESEKAYEWNIGKWEHWQPNYPKIQLTDTTAVIGGQLTFWEQTHEQVIPILRKKIPLIAEKLWSPQLTKTMKDELALTKMDHKFQTIFNPIYIETSNLLNKNDQTFTDSIMVNLSSFQEGSIRFAVTEDWDFIDMDNAKEFVEPFVLKSSAVLTAQAFDSSNKPVGYKIQEYFTKIKPAYSYKVYGHPPLKGWQTLPSSDTLDLIREGYTGRMNKERLSQINRRLFDKVELGHIDTRFYNQYNPYLLELSGTIEVSESGEYSIEMHTYDGLAEIYIDDKCIAKGEDFTDSAEYFQTDLSKGSHALTIKYYIKNIRNRLSIKYKGGNMAEYEPFENLVKDMVKYP
ncbi:family 20 glycosylhydrolase [Zobellia uliginosa]|uniref:family 20 glycosylhydrolase n=1 Tax=Zobellia uliginosa TaxID=143224 RepID=UPI0026E177FB|nr:family 20 glycosylhydrolase [Zobellia uliginosa]MDO6516522.1 family 20 glycosylhydrolase [Zobellia uliginosa]